MTDGGGRAGSEPRWGDDGRRVGPEPRWGDDGAGTVLAIALAGVVVLVGLVLGAVGAGVVARAGAQSAADLAALAAGDVLAMQLVLAGPESGVGSAGVSAACERADRVAARNGATLAGCTHEGAGVVLVHVSRATVLGAARAAARAGRSTQPPIPPAAEIGSLD